MAGYDIGAVEGIEWFSSRGPSIEGPLLKPDLSAPGLTWAALPGWQRSEPGAPQGYAVVRGTSLSAPIAAGGALLLLSGARQTGVQAGEAALRQALLSSARRLPGASAHEQGRGVMSVDGASDLLRRGVKPVQIDATAFGAPTDAGALLVQSDVVVVTEQPGCYQARNATTDHSYSHRGEPPRRAVVFLTPSDSVNPSVKMDCLAWAQAIQLSATTATTLTVAHKVAPHAMSTMVTAVDQRANVA